MARGNVSFNTNGLGTVYDVEVTDSGCTWKFQPADNCRIDYKWSYVCDVTYNNGNRPSHYTGEVRWSEGHDYDAGRDYLGDQYGWGSGSWLETATLVVTINGVANVTIPHSIEPQDAGQYHYFWGRLRSTQLSDGAMWHWAV